ncbi:cytidine deaminase, partial [Vibrio anguillarum]|nr:cytidine deaminase [Vibrio anguillarum]
MNWFESTGSINFQGKNPGKATLEVKVPKLLYPAEAESIAAPKVTTVTSEQRSPATNTTKTDSIERRYLTTGINEGELVIGIVSAVG